jgi:hypothetical protein
MHDYGPDAYLRWKPPRYRLVFLVVVVILLLLDFLDYRATLGKTRVQIVLWNLFMHQVLVAIDACRPFALHLGMCRFSGGSGRLRILVTGSARETIPFFKLHPSPVRSLRAVLIEFFHS